MRAPTIRKVVVLTVLILIIGTVVSPSRSESLDGFLAAAMGLSVVALAAHFAKVVPYETTELVAFGSTILLGGSSYATMGEGPIALLMLSIILLSSSAVPIVRSIVGV